MICTYYLNIPNIRISSFQKLGIKYVSLKPGSTESLGQVVAIARANPTFAIICQWTGGRAGGHHSFEDFHYPILSMYSTLRRCPNIILIAGSGFGGSGDTEPYLTGEWALKFAHPCMPFDGVLFGSRVMTALEARTSLAVSSQMTSLIKRPNKPLSTHPVLTMKIGKRRIKDQQEVSSQSVQNSVNPSIN
jgi:fatty acid synthase subunit beta, fungi type